MVTVCGSRAGVREHPALDPVIHCVVPEGTVGRLVDSVILIAKVQELAGDTAALQGREGRQSPSRGNAKIQGAMGYGLWITNIGTRQSLTWWTGLNFS